MAGREERLPPATRNYVIFGLLLVIALALAARDYFGPHTGRGEADSAIRMLVVGASPDTATALDEIDGLMVVQHSYAEVVEGGRELLDDDAPAYAAALAFADEHGCGFAALGLRGVGEPPDWQLDLDDPGIEALPGEAAEFVVFSVGDLAPEGPRMRAVELAAVEYDGVLAELDGIRLAFYDHPDLQALWSSESNVAHVQAREVLRARRLLERRETLADDQQRWRELGRSWPKPGVIPGSLAGPWEQVRAAPIRGGVLLEARLGRIRVDMYRRAHLDMGEVASLWFMPLAALADDEPDETRARVRCQGLPPTAEGGDIAVASDGSSMVLRESWTDSAKLFVFDEAAAAAGECRAKLAAKLELGDRGVGRTNGAGRMAWNYDEDFLHWFDAGADHSAQVYGIDAFSGPWWVDDRLLAMIAELDHGSPDYEIETVLVLFDTLAADGGRRLELDQQALFPPRDPDAPQIEAETLVDLRPSGPNELLLLTEHCVDDPSGRAPKPCVHRLVGERPLLELVSPPAAVAETTDADAARPFTIETLGPLGPYLALAMSANGDRALWVAGREGHTLLMWADLRGPARLDAHAVHEDTLSDSTPRISADGRLAVSEVALYLGELGSVSIARAALLPAPAREPRPAPEPAPEPGE